MCETKCQTNIFEDPNRSSRPVVQTADPLPMTPDEVQARGWSEVDVVFITGDAYVDSPSFANGLLARVLEADGFKVAVLSQPDWHSVDEFRKFGRPRLAFCVSAGNMDSMLNHYTANKKVRNDDAYSPGGKIGRRPDRATLSYCQRARQAFPGVPVLTGGVEASLRRIAHYDYWSDRVRKSILLDAKADILIYGMGERPILEIMRRLNAGESIKSIHDVRGTVWRLGQTDDYPEESDSLVYLPSYDDVSVNLDDEKRAVSVKITELDESLGAAFKELEKLDQERQTCRDDSKRIVKAISENDAETQQVFGKDRERDAELKVIGDSLQRELHDVVEKSKAIDARVDALKRQIDRTKAEIKALKERPYNLDKESKRRFVEMTRIAFDNLNPYCAKTLVQEHADQAIVVNPPAFPLSEAEMDAVYALPFTRKAHPSYTETIPAANVVRSTVQTHRGCFGGCHFCAITAHQGKFIQTRSEKAIVAEIKMLAARHGGDYVVSDLNAPTANMYRLGGKNKEACKSCHRNSCLCPQICPNLNVDQSAYVKLLEAVRNTEGVKQVFIASGIRTDLAIFAPEFVRALAEYHTGGHLKTAPEHVDDEVLKLMNKPSIENYEEFCELFQRESRAAGKEQYCIPYLISSFPGCTLASMVDVAVYLKKHDVRPEQVQDFIPAPFQLATCAYYTGIDPISQEEVYVPKSLRERRLQHALLFYYNPEFYYDVKQALKDAKREDLIGTGPDSLIPPYIDKDPLRLRSSQIKRFKKQSRQDNLEKDKRRSEIEDFDDNLRTDAQPRGRRRVGRETASNGGYRGGAKTYGRGGRFSDDTRFSDRRANDSPNGQDREQRRRPRPFDESSPRSAQGRDFARRGEGKPFDKDRRRGSYEKFGDRSSRYGGEYGSQNRENDGGRDRGRDANRSPRGKFGEKHGGARFGKKGGFSSHNNGDNNRGRFRKPKDE